MPRTRRTPVMCWRHNRADVASRLLQPYGYGTDPDTSRASYVWLPLRFEGDQVVLDWRDEWRVDEYT